MTSNGALRVAKRRVRINVTCSGILIALSEDGAIVQLPTPQPPHRQTTLAIEYEDGETVYIPARIVRTEPQTPSAPARPEHHVVVEFLELSRQTAAAIRALIDGTDTVIHGRTA